MSRNGRSAITTTVSRNTRSLYLLARGHTTFGEKPLQRPPHWPRVHVLRYGLRGSTSIFFRNKAAPRIGWKTTAFIFMTYPM